VIVAIVMREHLRFLSPFGGGVEGREALVELRSTGTTSVARSSAQARRPPSHARQKDRARGVDLDGLGGESTLGFARLNVGIERLPGSAC
jgi:hypothetical protein